MALPPDSLPAAGPVPDGELVVRARTGDEAAGEELVRRYRRLVYSVALQLLGNREDALDVAQDTLLRFFSRLGRFETHRPVKPWLLTIARNRARDLLRRRRVRRTEPLPGADQEERFRPELIDASAGPEDASRQAELKRQIWGALGSLPPEQREILVLRDYQDLSYSEIAAVLAVPVGTVMSRLHRARKALGRQLEGLLHQSRQAGAASPLQPDRATGDPPGTAP